MQHKLNQMQISPTMFQCGFITSNNLAVGYFHQGQDKIGTHIKQGQAGTLHPEVHINI
jgi:hypothetical protein